MIVYLNLSSPHDILFFLEDMKADIRILEWLQKVKTDLFHKVLKIFLLQILSPAKVRASHPDLCTSLLHNLLVHIMRERSNLPLLLAISSSTVSLVVASLAAEAFTAATEAALIALTTTLLTGLTVAVSNNVAGGRLALALIPDGIEGNGLTVVQRFESCRINSGEMDKDVLSTISRGDETETLFRVEEFDGTRLSHCCGCS